mmetsp:Transcript_8311/g.16060  ORF Transcript_8311/g.16060 Transcript_8311/m.16060 type:complete len:221 (+) Transcript_8311:2029-2691(+)
MPRNIDFTPVSYDRIGPLHPVLYGARGGFGVTSGGSTGMPRRVPRLGPQPFLNGVHVLVPTARHAAHDVHVSGAALTSLDGRSHGVGSLEGRQDALRARQMLETFESVIVRDAHILDPAGPLQVRMLGADTRIIQSSGDAVRGLDLPSRFILQEVGARPVHDPDTSLAQGGGVQVLTIAIGLDPVNLNAFVLHKRIERSDGIAAASGAGEHFVRQLPNLL